MESPSIGPSALGFLAIALLVLANAYFVATEFALVAVRRTQLELWSREGRRGASAALAATLDLDDAIAATQLGITLASIALGFVGEPTLARVMAGPLAALGFGEVVVHSAAIGIAFTLITFLHVVVGELAPKAIALDHPGRDVRRADGTHIEGVEVAPLVDDRVREDRAVAQVAVAAQVVVDRLELDARGRHDLEALGDDLGTDPVATHHADAVCHLSSAPGIVGRMLVGRLECAPELKNRPPRWTVGAHTGEVCASE